MCLDACSTLRSLQVPEGGGFEELCESGDRPSPVTYLVGSRADRNTYSLQGAYLFYWVAGQGLQ